MSAPAPPPNTPGKAGRNALVLLSALLGFGAAVLALIALPIYEDRVFWLAYPAVFAIAAVSIVLIFKLFVKRR